MRISGLLLLILSANLSGLWAVCAGEPASAWRAWPVPLCASRVQYQLPQDFQRLLPGMVIVQNNARIGSGVLISEDGYVLTAAHLVQNANAVAVYLNTGETVPGKIIRPHHASLVAPGQDIALVKIPGRSHACLRISSQPALPGSRIFSIGFSPAPNKEFAMQEGRVYEGVVRRTDDVSAPSLQTTIDLAPGSSGGALLNAHGQVVGIITGKIRLADHRAYSLGSPVGSMPAGKASNAKTRRLP